MALAVSLSANCGHTFATGSAALVSVITKLLQPRDHGALSCESCDEVLIIGVGVHRLHVTNKMPNSACTACKTARWRLLCSLRLRQNRLLVAHLLVIDAKNDIRNVALRGCRQDHLSAPVAANVYPGLRGRARYPCYRYDRVLDAATCIVSGLRTRSLD